MADTKISDLAAVTDVIATDEYVLARAGATKKIDASDLLVADQVSFTPTGTIAATDVQAAIAEVASEAAVTPPIVVISDTTLGSTTATFDLTSIPATYTHLRIALFGRASPATTGQNPQLIFNNDSASNYDYQVTVYNTTASAAEGVGVAFVRLGTIPADSAPANVFGTTIIDFPFYRSGAHKTLHYHQQLKLASSSTNIFTDTGSGLWRSTSVINRITIALNSGSFLTGSRCILYGTI